MIPIRGKQIPKVSIRKVDFRGQHQFYSSHRKSTVFLISFAEGTQTRQKGK